MNIRLLCVSLLIAIASPGLGQGNAAFTDAHLEAFMRQACQGQFTKGEGMDGQKLFFCGVCPAFTPAPGWTDPNGGTVWEFADRLEGRFSQSAKPEVMLTFQGCEQIDPGGGAVLLQWNGSAWVRLDYLSGPPFEPGFSSLRKLRQANGLDVVVGLNDFVRSGEHSLFLTASRYNRNAEGLLATQLLFKSHQADGFNCAAPTSSLDDTAQIKSSANGRLLVAFGRRAVKLDGKCQPTFGPRTALSLEWVLQGAQLVPTAATAKALTQLKIAP